MYSEQIPMNRSFVF